MVDLGLTKGQAAKTVAAFPQFLGLSVEKNLKPTVQLLLDLGLTQSQVAKALNTSPQILGYSIEQNLQPTVRWLLRFGVGKHKLASLIIGWPRFLGYSIAKNLDGKALLLETLCTRKGAREIISKNPEILRFSQQRIATRVRVLSKIGELSRVNRAMILSDEMFEKHFISQVDS